MLGQVRELPEDPGQSHVADRAEVRLHPLGGHRWAGAGARAGGWSGGGFFLRFLRGSLPGFLGLIPGLVLAAARTLLQHRHQRLLPAEPLGLHDALGEGHPSRTCPTPSPKLGCSCLFLLLSEPPSLASSRHRTPSKDPPSSPPVGSPLQAWSHLPCLPSLLSLLQALTPSLPRQRWILKGCLENPE